MQRNGGNLEIFWATPRATRRSFLESSCGEALAPVFPTGCVVQGCSSVNDHNNCTRDFYESAPSSTCCEPCAPFTRLCFVTSASIAAAATSNRNYFEGRSSRVVPSSARAPSWTCPWGLKPSDESWTASACRSTAQGPLTPRYTCRW